MAENLSDVRELEADLFESLGEAPVGLVIMRQAGEWYLGTSTGFVTAPSLGELINKAVHRGLIQ